MSDFSSVPIERVREFWDERPCNIRHSAKPIGTREYFDEVEARKYFVEPHIPGFAQFQRWNGRRVLEVGCGIGTDTINFARNGAQVTAVELSGKSIDIARRRAEVYELQDAIHFVEGNAEKLTDIISPEPYDLIYSFGVLHHTPNPSRTLEQISHFMSSESTLKLMVYHRVSWRVLSIVLKEGRGQFWRTRELVARHSEAQTGSPVTYVFSRREIRRLMARQGYEVRELKVDHIFPYRVADYVNYNYVKPWFFRIPAPLFRAMEKRGGWHLLVTAKLA